MKNYVRNFMAAAALGLAAAGCGFVGGNSSGKSDRPTNYTSCDIKAANDFFYYYMLRDRNNRELWVNEVYAKERRERRIALVPFDGNVVVVRDKSYALAGIICDQNRKPVHVKPYSNLSAYELGVTVVSPPELAKRASDIANWFQKLRGY